MTDSIQRKANNLFHLNNPFEPTILLLFFGWLIKHGNSKFILKKHLVKTEFFCASSLFDPNHINQFYGIWSF